MGTGRDNFEEGEEESEANRSEDLEKGVESRKIEQGKERT